MKESSRIGTRAPRGARAVLLAALLAAGCSATPPEPTTHRIAIRNFKYIPAAITVSVGDTVVFTNEDVVPHTATATNGAWDTGSIGANDTARIVLEGEGAHAYICAFHPNMKAELTAR